jgi:hypothetical protein
VGERAGVVKRDVADALDELVTEAALSRARLRGDQDHARPTGPRLAESRLEPRELVLAADEAGEATRPGALEAAPDRAGTPQLEHAHGNPSALEALLPSIEEVEEARGEARGLLGDRDPSRSRELLHPGREPDHVPLRGVVHAQVVADPPHDDLPGVEAHPHRELEAALASHFLGERAELAGQIQGGGTGALGVVLVGDRGAEERHDPVAGVLVDRPLVSVDAAGEDPEQAIEQAVPLLGIDALGQLHGAHHVGEEDGDQLALAPERALRREDLLDEMPRRVGARLPGDRRRDEGRATIVAEPRAGGVLVSAGWAAHRILAHDSRMRPCHASRLRRNVDPGEVVRPVRERVRPGGAMDGKWLQGAVIG